VRRNIVWSVGVCYSEGSGDEIVDTSSLGHEKEYLVQFKRGEFRWKRRINQKKWRLTKVISIHSSWHVPCTENCCALQVYTEIEIKSRDHNHQRGTFLLHWCAQPGAIRILELATSINMIESSVSIRRKETSEKEPHPPPSFFPLKNDPNPPISAPNFFPPVPSTNPSRIHPGNFPLILSPSYRLSIITIAA
jgi:hypothetical protein